MEHYRSTLGTAAIAAIGLLVAARVLHPGNFEHSPRVARPVQSHAATTSTVAMVRSDPPYGPYMRPGASSPGMAVLAPRLTAPLPAGMTMMPVLPAATGQNHDAFRSHRADGGRSRPDGPGVVVGRRVGADWDARRRAT